MNGNINIEPIHIVYFLACLIGLGLIVSLLLLIYVLAQIRRIRLPPNADVYDTLLATPFIVVVLLDLLDFSLDFLSAPFAWVLLGRLGLEKLRGVTVLESLIPFTQFIPTMTLAWIIVRWLGPRRIF